MTRRNVPIALYLFLVFVSGAVVGALGYRTYNPPTAKSVSPARLTPDEWRRQYLDEMRTRLSLTDDQMQKLNVILDQTNVRFQEAREKDNQLIGQIREDHFARVRTILTADQVPKYEQLHKEREERAKKQEQQNQR